MSDRVDELLDGMVSDGVISGYEQRNKRQMIVVRDGRRTVLNMRILTQLVAQDDGAARLWVSTETEHHKPGETT